MVPASLTALAVLVADLLIRVGLSVRVIMRRRPVGVSLAWLTIILIFPFAGAAIYLLFGELRLGRRRADYAARIHDPYQRWLGDLRGRSHVDWSIVGAECEPQARLSEVAGGIPALPGNELHLLDDAEAVFDALLADIAAARRTCPHGVLHLVRRREGRRGGRGTPAGQGAGRDVPGAGRRGREP